MRSRLRRWALAHGILVSALLHGSLFGGALGYLHWRESALDRAIDIDLRGQSLLSRPANPQGGARQARPPEPWYLAGGRRPAPAPQVPPPNAPPEAPETAGPACPPPCPEHAGDWIPAASASRKPVWSQGLITEDDYPRDLRRAGQEGTVVAEVLIDATGAVRDVQLRQTSHPEFDALVLARLRAAHFRPAYDQNGDPVACRLILPIVFQLN